MPLSYEKFVTVYRFQAFCVIIQDVNFDKIPKTKSSKHEKFLKRKKNKLKVFVTKLITRIKEADDASGNISHEISIDKLEKKNNIVII